ncbi:hypothetical protein HDU93_006176, partial [Gonapodya sp. JEL0774]
MIDVGFMYVTGFSEPTPVVIDGMFDLAKRLFVNLTPEEKLRYARAGKPSGFTDVGTETLEPGVFDVKECYNLARRVLDPRRGGPTEEELPSFLRETANLVILREFVSQSHELSLRVLRAFAISLQLDPEFFVEKHSYDLDDEGGDNLRLLHYPPVPDHVLEKWKEGGFVEGKRAIRAGAHGDYGSLTLLFQRDESGLQVLDKHTDGDVWIDAPVIPGSVVVNTGDLMEYWTRGLYKSTTHRVAIPVDIGSQKRSRYSIPFFVQPNDDVVLSPVPSPLIADSVDKFEKNRIEQNLPPPAQEFTSLG